MFLTPCNQMHKICSGDFTIKDLFKSKTPSKNWILSQKFVTINTYCCKCFKGQKLFKNKLKCKLLRIRNAFRHWVLNFDQYLVAVVVSQDSSYSDIWACLLFSLPVNNKIENTSHKLITGVLTKSRWFSNSLIRKRLL